MGTSRDLMTSYALSIVFAECYKTPHLRLLSRIGVPVLPALDAARPHRSVLSSTDSRCVALPPPPLSFLHSVR